MSAAGDTSIHSIDIVYAQDISMFPILLLLLLGNVPVPFRVCANGMRNRHSRKMEEKNEEEKKIWQHKQWHDNIVEGKTEKDNKSVV